MTRSSASETGSTRRPRHTLTLRHLYPLVPIGAVAWRAVTPLSDNSFLWHVRAGTIQLESGQVLRVDPFTFLYAGESWRTQSWLAELFYGWLENLTGSVQWSPSLMFLLMGSTLAFVGLAVYNIIRLPGRTALVMVAVAWPGMLFVVPRPVIFSFLLLAVFVVILQHPERLSWALVPLTWLWASLHGLFVVGLALVALEALRRRSWHLLGVGVVAGTTVFLTAHGLGVINILLDFAQNRDALALLSEWKRPDFLSAGLSPAVLVALGIIWALVSRKLDRSAAFVALPFLLLGAVQLRSVFPALIVLASFAAAAIGSDRPRATTRAGTPVVNYGIGAAMVLLALAGLARPIGRDTNVLPTPEAVEALSTDRVLHGPGAGGLLIWEQHPSRLVFMDDRAELMGVDLFQDFIDFRAGETGSELADRYGLDEALLKTSWAAADTLVGEGWTETHRDEQWVVLVRP